MKTISLILGFLMLAWTALWGIMFWTGIYGGIGFFGSILTTPFSQMIAILINMFSDIVTFIIWVVWFVVMFVFMSYGSE